MSGSVKLKLPAGGSKTISAPDSASDETITLPAGTKTLLATDGDGSSLTGISSGADTSLSNLSATGENKVCQAWVNFNGTGTVAIRDSHNVSSITDNGTGDYRINFTNSMANANFSAVGTAKDYSTNAWARMVLFTSLFSTSSISIQTMKPATEAVYDTDLVCLQVFGD